MIDMAAEKFFGEKDPLVTEVGGSIARQSNVTNSEDITKKIQKVLDERKEKAGVKELSTEYDLSSAQHPNQAATLEAILNNSDQYIPYLTEQLKDLFVAGYNKAQESKH